MARGSVRATGTMNKYVAGNEYSIHNYIYTEIVIINDYIKPCMHPFTIRGNSWTY